jgi:sec-independent protein translocase protein TatB
MFELSWGEIALIGVVALIVIGPKELPGVLRAMGQALAKLRRMASDFQYQFNQALQEAEVDKVKSSINSVTDGVSSTSNFNPIDYARDQIKSAVGEVKGTPATPAADMIGPPAPDPLASAIPAPPNYSVDPASIANAFRPSPVEPPAGFVAAVQKAAEPVAEPPAPVAAPPAEIAAPAEPVAEAAPEKPRRAGKTKA